VVLALPTSTQRIRMVLGRLAEWAVRNV